MRIKETVNPCACPFLPPLGAWNTCWLMDFGSSPCKAGLLPHVHKWLTSSASLCPTGVIPEWLYEFIDPSSRARLRILGEKRARRSFLTTQKALWRISHKGNGSRWPSPNVHFFLWQLLKGHKNSDLFGGLAGPQSSVGKDIHIILRKYYWYT